MATLSSRWQRVVLSSGQIESGGNRTVRDWIVDGAVFAIAVLAGAFVLTSTWDKHSTLVAIADIALGAVACTGLWWRRERPLTVALVAVVLSSVSALAAMATLPAVFNAAIRLPLRRLTGVCALAVLGTAIFPILYPSVGDHGYLWQVAVGVLLTLVALGWGLFVRAQRELVGGLHRRAEDRAREAERRRIAREMHDVLAHRLSILSVHAGALENAGDRLPAEYLETASVIRSSAHTALEELREVIGLLRDSNGGSGTEAPQPTLDEIPALVEESRTAGLPVNYHDGVRVDVPSLIGRTAYRTVQEGLTNARKHGGEVVDVNIDAVGSDRPLVVEVISRGSGLMPGLPGAGAGLGGLAERVALAGGEFERGPDGHGNFILRATLPLVR